MENENLLQIFHTVHAFFFFSFRFVIFLLKAHTCTMNFNFTLDFLESYFQFNRKYLFEVILHFRPHPAGTAIRSS